MFIAKGPGTCVLSGHPIEAGDAVYSPGAGDPPPRNAGAMMVAASVNVPL
ncbi:DUF3331 domain-containing protein [Paraburkholderia sp. UCT31]|nr:DUF3331 domain-containing protein [Paraburkholderia sp. UCT31]